VIGILLLLVILAVRGRLRPASDDLTEDPTGGAAEGLLRHLGLLFVPAGVGIVQHLDLLAAHAGAVLAALLVSTAATLVVSVLVFRAVAGRFGAEDR
jgi:putative effector of murein hydrolase LrgA (UPF0299 family)